MKQWILWCRDHQGPTYSHILYQLCSFSFLWLMQLKGRAALYWRYNAVKSSEKHPQICWGWSNLAKSSHILASGALVFMRVTPSVPQRDPSDQLASLGNFAPGCLYGYADAFEEKLGLIWVVLMLLWVKPFIACQFVNGLLIVLLRCVIKADPSGSDGDLLPAIPPFLSHLNPSCSKDGSQPFLSQYRTD